MYTYNITVLDASSRIIHQATTKAPIADLARLENADPRWESAARVVLSLRRDHDGDDRLHDTVTWTLPPRQAKADSDAPVLRALREAASTVTAPVRRSDFYRRFLACCDREAIPARDRLTARAIYPRLASLGLREYRRGDLGVVVAPLENVD